MKLIVERGYLVKERKRSQAGDGSKEEARRSLIVKVVEVGGLKFCLGRMRI